MTKLEAIRIMLEIVTECDRQDSEGGTCRTCPFGDDSGSCMASTGTDIPHDWTIKNKLRDI